MKAFFENCRKNIREVCLMLIAFIIGLFFCYLNLHFQEEEKFLIYAIEKADSNTSDSLISMKFDGNLSQRLLFLTGAIGFSKDGNYLATGCSQDSNVCIYDVKNFADWTIYPPKFPIYGGETKITLPLACKQIIGNNGVNSISWSNDGSRIIIICQNESQSNACILDLKGKSFCWGEKTGDDIYSRADWSPKGDLIVIDTGKTSIKRPKGDFEFYFERTGRTMQIVDIDGKTKKKLIDGWSPVWSYDGKKIAFFRVDEERGSPGVGIIDIDGSNFHWVYRPPMWNTDENLVFYRPIFVDAFFSPNSSKLSWSPDNKYLVFDSISQECCSYGIYRLEIASGKLEKLTTNISNKFREPVAQFKKK